MKRYRLLIAGLTIAAGVLLGVPAGANSVGTVTIASLGSYQASLTTTMGANSFVACPASGSCVAASSEITPGAIAIASQAAGKWRISHTIVIGPSIVGNPTANSVYLYGLACSSVGNCTILAYVTTKSTATMDVATEANGVWGQLKQVGPDGRVLDSVRQGVATPVTVVCPAKTICFAGGSQNVKSANLEAMVDEIVSGVPQPLTTLRFPSSVHLESAGVMTLSCSSAKSCLASGLAYKKGGGAYAFTATRNNGSWGDAVLSSSPILLGGLTKPFASSVWCSNATNCVVTGTINYAGAFASVEKDGIWSAAKTIIPNNGAYSIDPGMDPLSCSSISNCVQLYGATQGPSAASRSLAVSLVGGQWHKAVSLDTLSDATATSASDSSCTKSSCSFVLSYLTHKTVAGSSPYVVFTERFLSESSGDGGWVSTSSPAL